MTARINNNSSCPCNCLINTAFSSVYVNYDKWCSYNFGSIYYNNHNTISIKDWPREPLTLNQKATSLLEDTVRSAAFWYKSQMIARITVGQSEDGDEDLE